ncbi:putative membrane protein [Rhodotorula toruloides]|nr:putative membrane protein [Rhodotorula toruloides]
MPASADRQPSDATAERPFASSSSSSAPTSMLQRGPVRERNVEDEIELVENGTYPSNGGAREEKTGLVSGIVGERSIEAGGEGGTLSTRDKRALALLVALYLLQGIPVGLAFGSIPFLLRSKLSYSQIGIFTLCTYPYSLKLLWSPIVDSIFSPKLGRRKSWIVPIQTIVGILFWWLGNNVQQMMEVEEPNVHLLTSLFFTLVFFAATQDIAVDGWALTLLSKENLSYASTAQTIGLNTGYFLSFTVFLAFNSVEFSNKYFRSTPLDYPLISLSGYLHFWAFAFVAVTAYLAFFQPEDPVTAQDQDDMDLKKVYSIMVEICKLKHVQSFMMVHLVTKLGTAANDAATSLKLLEKGLKKEDLALAVLIDFPFQILFGYLAAKWSKGEKPLRPWLIAMWTRLGWAAISMLLISNFPKGDIGTWYFLLVVACTVGSSFSRRVSSRPLHTVQFVGISAFHTQIADPLIGGTYMTLLNTVSNLGGTWPKFFVLKGIDAFSVAVCHVKDEGLDVIVSSRECVSDHGKAACAELGGTCLTERDGYYWVSTLCILTGVAILVSFVQPVARRLQTLPAAAWRIKRNGR